MKIAVTLRTENPNFVNSPANSICNDFDINIRVIGVDEDGDPIEKSDVDIAIEEATSVEEAYELFENYCYNRVNCPLVLNKAAIIGMIDNEDFTFLTFPSWKEIECDGVYGFSICVDDGISQEKIDEYIQSLIRDCSDSGCAGNTDAPVWVSIDDEMNVFSSENTSLLGEIVKSNKWKLYEKSNKIEDYISI